MIRTFLQRAGRRRGDRPATIAAAPGLEALESRVLLSVTDPVSAFRMPITTTASTAPVYLPADAVVSGITASQTPTWGRLINLDDFRADSRFAGIDGSGFASVVIDTGIDLNHSFFGPDADGNGVADRIVFDYDFYGLLHDSNASDGQGHGSNVASIIASSDPTYNGMAPDANIIALKVFSDLGAGGTFGDIEEALQWTVNNAAAYNIASVNLSLGDSGNYTTSQSLYGIADELAALANLNVIVAAAAGNDFFSHNSAQGVSYPAADPNALAVSAVYASNIGSISYASGATAYSTAGDRITPFSQRHASLTDIFAPGAPITGANATGGTVTMHGTSQAAPHIAGIALLMQELAVQELGRRLSTSEFVSLMRSSAATIHDGDNEDDNVINTGLNFPRLDVLALGNAILNLVAPAPTPEPAPAPGAAEIIVDNSSSGSPGVTLVGNWFASASPAGFIGSNYLHEGGSGWGRSATFTADITTDGRYAVYANWTSTTNRASNVPVTIAHRDGTASLTLDQRVGWGQWNLLGEYEFTAAGDGKVTLANNRANGVVVADAVKFVRMSDGTAPAPAPEPEPAPTPEPEPTPTPGPTEVVVDNSSTGLALVGSWFASGSPAGFIGSNYLHEGGSGWGRSATFTADLTSDGRYAVYANWTSASNRASNIPVTIAHRDGTASLTLDQRVGGGKWNLLGEFSFTAAGDGKVTLSNQKANGVVVADAVKFVRIGDLTATTTGGGAAVSRSAALIAADTDILSEISERLREHKRRLEHA